MDPVSPNGQTPGRSAVDGAVEGGDSGTIAAAVLEMDERRRTEEPDNEPVIFADDLLPGVTAESMTLRQGLQVGGSATLIILVLLSSLDQLSSAGLSVLAPNIRDTLHVSNGAIVFIASSAGGFLVLGALPMGWLADRYRRAPIIAWASLVFGAMLAVTGLAVNAFMLFWTQLGVGVSKANTISVQWSLIADQYPIGVRGRISAALNFGTQSASALSPILMAGIATLAGGAAGWRWSFIALSVPVVIVALVRVQASRTRSRSVREVERSRDGDRRRRSGSHLNRGRVRSDSTSQDFDVGDHRLRCVGILSLHGSRACQPIPSAALPPRHLLSGPCSHDRSLVCTSDLADGRSPLRQALSKLIHPRPSRCWGWRSSPPPFSLPIQYFMPNWELYTLVGVPQVVLFAAAFTMCGPVFQSVLPYRLRGLGSALGAIYIFFIGATGGALIAAFLINQFNARVAVIAITVPATLLGGLFIIRSSRSIRQDLSLVVAELQEEMAEHERQAQEPGRIPVLQVNNIDFSYGNVQVLHDVGFEVYRGEVLALLGTNGAGKSSILRVIAGLGTASRGVVRLNGRTITYVSPENRAKLGIHMLPGGKSVFPSMTVAQNLEMGAYMYRKDPADRQRRTDRVLELFPGLAAKLSDRADSLSGGQQQMLGLARALLHDPEILLIDELSLGLAPVIVQELLGILERLSDEGLTIVIVEQSIDIALSIADRAVFMEKGEVRFEGQARGLEESR